MLKGLNLESNHKLLRYQIMLTYEGVALFICLLLGAFAIFYFIYRENKILRERRDFLSLFTHDLKTTISSLRLMLERLGNKAEKSPYKEDVKSVQRIGNKLGQQLQNALQVTFESDQKLVLEKLNFVREINYLKSLWPDLSVFVEDEIKIYSDSVALRSVCTNLIQNAVDHASADTIVFKKNLRYKKGGFVGIDCSTPGAEIFNYDLDDFKKTKRAGQSVDGTGLGLRLSEKIMEKMGGFISYDLLEDKTLRVSLFFKEEGGAL